MVPNAPQSFLHRNDTQVVHLLMYQSHQVLVLPHTERDFHCGLLTVKSEWCSKQQAETKIK